jgi:hypothetical protein
VTRTRGGRGPRRERRLPERLPKRPYRDSAIVFAVLALIVVGVAWATGGDIVRAVLFGGGFFVVATGWSWWRFRQRIEADRLEAKRAEAGGGGRPEA